MWFLWNRYRSDIGRYHRDRAQFGPAMGPAKLLLLASLASLALASPRRPSGLKKCLGPRPGKSAGGCGFTCNRRTGQWKLLKGTLQCSTSLFSLNDWINSGDGSGDDYEDYNTIEQDNTTQAPVNQEDVSAVVPGNEEGSGEPVGTDGLDWLWE